MGWYVIKQGVCLIAHLVVSLNLCTPFLVTSGAILASKYKSSICVGSSIL